jgi:hypothetical protein
MDALCLACGEPVATELFCTVTGPVKVELKTFCPSCGFVAQSEDLSPDANGMMQGGLEYGAASAAR